MSSGELTRDQTLSNAREAAGGNAELFASMRQEIDAMFPPAPEARLPPAYDFGAPPALEARRGAISSGPSPFTRTFSDNAGGAAAADDGPASRLTAALANYNLSSSNPRNATARLRELGEGSDTADAGKGKGKAIMEADEGTEAEMYERYLAYQRSRIPAPARPSRHLASFDSTVRDGGTIRIPSELELELARQEARLEHGHQHFGPPMIELRVNPDCTLEEFVDNQIKTEKRDKKQQAAKRKKTEAVRQRGEESRRILAELQRYEAEQRRAQGLEASPNAEGSSTCQPSSSDDSVGQYDRVAVERRIRAEQARMEAIIARIRSVPQTSSAHVDRIVDQMREQHAQRRIRLLNNGSAGVGRAQEGRQTGDGEMADYDPRQLQMLASGSSAASRPVSHQPQQIQAAQTNQVEFFDPMGYPGIARPVPITNPPPRSSYPDAQYAAGPQGNRFRASPLFGAPAPQDASSIFRAPLPNTSFPVPAHYNSNPADPGNQIPASTIDPRQLSAGPGDQRNQHSFPNPFNLGNSVPTSTTGQQQHGAGYADQHSQYPSSNPFNVGSSVTTSMSGQQHGAGYGDQHNQHQSQIPRLNAPSFVPPAFSQLPQMTPDYGPSYVQPPPNVVIADGSTSAADYMRTVLLSQTEVAPVQSSPSGYQLYSGRPPTPGLSARGRASDAFSYRLPTVLRLSPQALAGIDRTHSQQPTVPDASSTQQTSRAVSAPQAPGGTSHGQGQRPAPTGPRLPPRETATSHQSAQPARQSGDTGARHGGSGGPMPQ